eukprot:1973552-Rhodomonas_salina.1
MHWWIQNIHQINGQPIATIHAPLTLDSHLVSDTGWGGCVFIMEEHHRALTNSLLANLQAHCQASVPVSLARRQLHSGLDVYGAFKASPLTNKPAAQLGEPKSATSTHPALDWGLLLDALRQSRCSVPLRGDSRV